MKKRAFRKSILILGCGFVALFLFRFLYGYISYPAGGDEIEQVAGSGQSTFNYEGKNYASKSGKPVKMGGSGTRAPLQIDQKYEKVGTVSMKSKEFESDEKEIRKAIDEVNGLIQFEQSSGLQGQRSLHLAVGVVPEKFDGLVHKLRTFGTLLSIRTDKVDKTNEYKMLQAKRTSLEATKESLQSLKKLGSGSIEELIQLEGRISETESQIQDLGVNLGEYDAENEFCTAKCSLLEVSTKTIPGIGLARRFKVALEWTVTIYLKLVIIGLVGTFTVWGMIGAVGKLHQFTPVWKRWMES